MLRVRPGPTVHPEPLGPTVHRACLACRDSKELRRCIRDIRRFPLDKLLHIGDTLHQAILLLV